MTGFPFVDPYERAISKFESRGYVVHRLADDLSVMLCPACLRRGRHEVLEIRRSADGVRIGGCHERRAS